MTNRWKLILAVSLTLNAAWLAQGQEEHWVAFGLAVVACIAAVVFAFQEPHDA